MVAADRLKTSGFAFWCLALSVCLLPIGFGGNRPLPIGLAQTGLAISCFTMLLGSHEWRFILFPRRLLWALGMFVIVALWALAQTLPILPAGWAHPLWQEAGMVLDRPLRGVVAILPEESIRGLSRLVTYIATGVLAYCLTQNTRAARRLLQIFWVIGAAVCVYGLIVYVAGAQKLLWFDKWAYQDDLTATFVNRNHFAIYAGMVLIAGVALFVDSWRNEVGARDASERLRSLRVWLSTVGVPHAIFIALVFVSILCSHSRAGLMLDIAGLGAYLFFDQIYRRSWRKAVLIAFCSLVALALTFFFAQYFSVRFALLFNDYSSLDRLKVMGWTIDGIRDNPWLGYGLNGFQPVFRLYERNMVMEFTHAHSDILESLLDLGLPAGLLLWGAIGLVVSGLAHGVLRRRRNGMFPAVALAASLLTLGHAAVDFDMQIPGVVMTWAILVGAGLAHSWRKSEKEPDQEKDGAAPTVRARAPSTPRRGRARSV